MKFISQEDNLNADFKNANTSFKKLLFEHCHHSETANIKEVIAYILLARLSYPAKSQVTCILHLLSHVKCQGMI
jgi:hypothetical protein